MSGQHARPIISDRENSPIGKTSPIGDTKMRVKRLAYGSFPSSRVTIVFFGS